MNSQTGRVIVGYDGSPNSCTALDWVASHAQRHGMPLTVLNVVDYLGQLPGTLPTMPMPHRVEQAAGHPAAGRVTGLGCCPGPEEPRVADDIRRR